MVNAHSATYPHVNLFSTSETNYLPWILLTVTSSTTTRFQSTSSSPILSWMLSPWKPIGRWSSRSIVSPASCCFSHLLSQSLDLIGKLGGHLLDHGFQSLISSFVRFVFLRLLHVPFLSWLTSCRLHLLSGGFHVLLLNSTKGCAQFIKSPDSVKVICRNILEFLIQASPEHAAKNFIRVAGDGSLTASKSFQPASPIIYWFYGFLVSAVDCSKSASVSTSPKMLSVFFNFSMSVMEASVPKRTIMLPAFPCSDDLIASKISFSRWFSLMRLWTWCLHKS